MVDVYLHLFLTGPPGLIKDFPFTLPSCRCVRAPPAHTWALHLFASLRAVLMWTNPA